MTYQSYYQKKMTVKEFIAEWLSVVQIMVKQSIYANYIMKVEKYILPVFSGLIYSRACSNKNVMHAFSTNFDNYCVEKICPNYARKITHSFYVNML